MKEEEDRQEVVGERSRGDVKVRGHVSEVSSSGSLVAQGYSGVKSRFRWW